MKIQPVESSYIVGIDPTIISLDDAAAKLTEQGGVTITNILREMNMILVRSISPVISFEGVTWVEADQAVNAL